MVLQWFYAGRWSRHTPRGSDRISHRRHHSRTHLHCSTVSRVGNSRRRSYRVSQCRVQNTCNGTYHHWPHKRLGFDIPRDNDLHIVLHRTPRDSHTVCTSQRYLHQCNFHRLNTGRHFDKCRVGFFLDGEAPSATCVTQQCPTHRVQIYEGYGKI